jgi:hypothetical protein
MRPSAAERFCCRTGGKLSVTSLEAPVFIPEGVPFTAVFAGGGSTKGSSRGMTSWRERATVTLNNQTLLKVP